MAWNPFKDLKRAVREIDEFINYDIGREIGNFGDTVVQWQREADKFLKDPGGFKRQRARMERMMQDQIDQQRQMGEEQQEARMRQQRMLAQRQLRARQRLLGRTSPSGLGGGGMGMEGNMIGRSGPPRKVLLGY